MSTEPVDRTEPTGLEDPRGAFVSLQNPDYRNLFWGGVFGFVAVGMQITARSVLALELTDSTAALAAVMFAFGIGMVLMTPVGGIAADRVARRTLIAGSHISLTVSSLFLGIVDLIDVEAFWMVLLVSLVHGASFAFMGPARVALVGDLVGQRSMPNALALTQLTVSGSQIIGPSAAGFLIAAPAFGTAGVYLLTAALTAIGLIPVMRVPKITPESEGRRSPLAELADGVSYVLTWPRLRLVVGTAFIGIIIGMPYLIFLPKTAETVFGVGAGWLGILYAANAVGGTAASLYTARIHDPAAVWRLRIVSGFGLALGLVLLAASPDQWVALPVLMLAGGSVIMFQTTSMSTAMLLAAPTYHGRVQSILMLSFSSASLVSLPLGTLADAVGLREVQVLMGVTLGMVMVTSTLLSRHIDGRPAPGG